MIMRDASMLDGGLSIKALESILSEHAQRVIALNGLRAYYDGKHAILQRKKTDGTSNNKIVVNHAMYIVDLASAYLIGSPVGYSVNEEQEKALSALADAYKRCNIDSVDAELAKRAGIYGLGVELLYMSMEPSPRPRTAAIDPQHAFVVYDDTVAHEPLLGVHLVQKVNADGMHGDLWVSVYTATSKYSYVRRGTGATPELVGEEPHYFGGVPIVEYWNNEDERGDFVTVTTLIDAYNLLMSDRINDKEQLVDALLMISGVTLGDTDDEFNRAVRRLRDQRILEMPAVGAAAAYLTKQLNETEMQVLADALVRDIHKVAMVPALTDDNFANNASGVAMRYKLLGLEQLTKTKERWFREGLRSRMRLFANVLAVKGHPLLDTETVTMTFSRGLPVNGLEQAQMVSMLQGIVPDEILLKQLPFVEDESSAIEALKEQKIAAVKESARKHGLTPYPDANIQGGGEVEADA